MHNGGSSGASIMSRDQNASENPQKRKHSSRMSTDRLLTRKGRCSELSSWHPFTESPSWHPFHKATLHGIPFKAPFTAHPLSRHPFSCEQNESQTGVKHDRAWKLRLRVVKIETKTQATTTKVALREPVKIDHFCIQNSAKCNVIIWLYMIRESSWWEVAASLFSYFEDTSLFSWATDTTVLDFWWRLPWVSTPGHELF